MFILPLSGKISKKNPPFITIGIILINTFIFFVFQSGDDQRLNQAMAYYFDSGLAKVEISKYLEYVGSPKGTDNESDSLKQKDLDKEALAKEYLKMREDDAFAIKLRNDEIITPDDAAYAEWKDLRTEFEALLNQVVFLRYGFAPASKNYFSAFTHMFLHGSFMHLLGNMVFLWLVGCVLELGCGRMMYLIMYLLTGLCSAGLFYLVYMNSTVPCIGASGAISGLIGAYTVLYGKRKIKVFYSLGFYFNYARVPAIFLLPVWVGNELFQLLFASFSNIAYVAHIGGLLSGGLLGYLNLRFLNLVDQQIFDEDPKERIPALFEKALQLVGTLDMDEARPVIKEILEIEPDNRRAMLLLFNVDKLTPQGEHFPKTATKLLTNLSRDREARDLLYETYKDYCRIHNPPKLTSDLSCTIASIFIEQGYLQESEQLMALVLRSQPEYRMIPGGLLKLGRAYLRKGMKKKAFKCLQIIWQKYRESSEAKIALGLLKRLKAQLVPTQK